MTKTLKATFQAPVSQLITLGREALNGRDWPDYLDQFNITQADIPELIRLATDNVLDWDAAPEWYGPMHAYRALGQLKATEAIEPLLSLAHMANESDWHQEELPEVFGLIGPKALPAMAQYMAGNHGIWPRSTVAHGIEVIGNTYPESREQCVQHLIDALDRHAEQPEELNGSLVAYLMDLEAVEAAPAIAKAYKEGPMDERVCGTWPAIQVEMGLAKREDFAPEELRLPPPPWMLPKSSSMAKTMTMSPLNSLNPRSTKRRKTESKHDLGLGKALRKTKGKPKNKSKNKGFGGAVNNQKKK